MHEMHILSPSNLLSILQHTWSLPSNVKQLTLYQDAPPSILSWKPARICHMVYADELDIKIEFALLYHHHNKPDHHARAETRSLLAPEDHEAGGFADFAQSQRKHADMLFLPAAQTLL
jgi:hypothetical protein